MPTQTPVSNQTARDRWLYMALLILTTAAVAVVGLPADAGETMLLERQGALAAAPTAEADDAVATAKGQVPYAISSFTIDAGGRSQGGSLVLDCGIGQPDAGTSAGGTLVLVGGFWTGTGSVIFLDGFEDGAVDRWSPQGP